MTRERILIGSKDGGGYPVILLWRNNKHAAFHVHTLVLLAFVGPRPPKEEARHFPDNTKTNNRLDNLSWATHKTNNADKIIHGWSQLGEKNKNAVLSEAKVREIRQLYFAGETSYTSLGKRFGVGIQTIWNVVNRVSWKHVV